MSSKDETSSEAEDDASEQSFELPDALATGREKRRTAGNRLRDMLNAELESEAIFAEDAEDEDFGSEQEQQDDLDSELDNASSDDQPMAEAEDAGEQLLQKQEKDSARARKKRQVEAFNKPKTVNHAASRSNRMPSGAKTTNKPRNSAQAKSALGIKRQSSRAHAVEIADAVERRLTEEARKKAKTSMKTLKAEEQPLTQAERLEEAKATEARNIASLHKIVQYEEDKRANQKLIAARRKAIGPFLRFVSTNKDAEVDSPSRPSLAQAVSPSPQAQSQISSLAHPLDNLRGIVADNTSVSSSIDAARSPIAPPAASTSRRITNFITIHDPQGEQYKEKEEFRQIILGGEIQTYSKPGSRPLCSLSGLPALYKDPATEIPYGNQRAYTMLQQLKKGDTPWNPQLKMPQSHVLHEESTPATANYVARGMAAIGGGGFDR